MISTQNRPQDEKKKKKGKGKVQSKLNNGNKNIHN